MSYLESMGLLVGVALSIDLACAKYREWHAKRLAIKRGRTLTTKFALSAYRSGVKP